MKKILPVFFVSVLSILSAVACSNDPGAGGENPYQESMVVDNQQVWKHNKSAVKVSQVFQEYNGNHDIVAVVSVPSEITFSSLVQLGDKIDDPHVGPVVGKIENGIMNFAVLENDIKNHLLKWDNNYCPECGYSLCDHHEPGDSNCGNDLFFAAHACKDCHWVFLSRFFREWKNTAITPSDAKGNIILISACPNASGATGGIDRHGFSGTENSLTNETILYLYVDKPCVISGDPSQGYIPGNYYYYTQGALNLTLKKGFNLITRGEKYLSYLPGEIPNASAYISMEIRNPLENPEKYRWAIELGFTF